MKLTVCVIALLLLNHSYNYAQKLDFPANLNGTAQSVSIFPQGIRHVADSGSKPVVVAPWFVERFKISAGFFVPLSNTNIGVSRNNGNNGTDIDDIDFEDDLGLRKSTGTFLADFQWRASRRSRFDLSFYRLNRSATKTLNKEINFSDSTYGINATVKGFFNTDIYRFSYGYALLAKPKYELGLMAGVHVVRSNVGVALNTPNASVSVDNDFGVTAPLPNLGLWGGYAISSRVAMNAEIDWLSATIGDIKGRIWAYNILFRYKVVNNLDLSLGYSGLNFKVDVTKKERSGSLKWGNNGPAFTVTYSFGNRPWVH